MSISDLFNAALPGLNGLTTDLYTVCICAIGCLLIGLGAAVLRSFLMREKETAEIECPGGDEAESTRGIGADKGVGGNRL